MSRLTSLESAFLSWLTDVSQPAWAKTFTVSAGWIQEEMRSQIGNTTQLFLHTVAVDEVGKVGAKRLDRHLLELAILAAMPAKTDATLDQLAEQILTRIGTGIDLGAAGRIVRATRENPQESATAQSAMAWECRLTLEGEVFA